MSGYTWPCRTNLNSDKNRSFQNTEISTKLPHTNSWTLQRLRPTLKLGLSTQQLCNVHDRTTTHVKRAAQTNEHRERPNHVSKRNMRLKNTCHLRVTRLASPRSEAQAPARLFAGTWRPLVSAITNDVAVALCDPSFIGGTLPCFFHHRVRYCTLSAKFCFSCSLHC